MKGTTVFDVSVAPHVMLHNTHSISYRNCSEAAGLRADSSLNKALIYWFQQYGVSGFFQGENVGDLIRGLDLPFAPSKEGDEITFTGMQAKMARVEMIGGLLGQRAYQRLAELAQTEAGWDDDNASAMSLNSLALLHTFILKMHERLNPSDIGFYLGYDGEIFINWTQRDGSIIDLAFRENRVEVYSDTWEEVYTISDPELYKKVSEV